MKYLFISLIPFLLLLVFGLISENYAQVSITEVKERNEQQVIKPEDLLTLELTFGSEIYGTKDEYLLVSPGGIKITNNGDIVLSDMDEYTVKIYDKHGKGKKIIGRRGQGPGEFIIPPGLSISPKGYFTAYEFITGYYSIFSPDYKFINKKRIRSSSLISEDWLINKKIDPKSRVSINNIICLDLSVRIYHLYLRNDDVSRYILLYEDDTTDVTVILNQKTDEIKNITKNLISSLTAPIFKWGLLPANRIFYCQNNEYEYNEKTGWEYTFHIVSLDNFEYKTFKHKFEPVPYSKSFLENVVSTNPNLKKFGKEAEKEREKMQKALKEKKYWSPVQNVMFDRNYVFFILNNDYEKGNNLVEVYDSDADVFVSSFYAPWGDFNDKQPNIINNGYAYNVETDEDGFKVICKYKINPAVYGK
ncbi:hypothetical protein AMJ80_08095 [bacterium SM23_31]|nr:MAG: hypothetical protein AMJ80_08095 [bacterium SM23_31]